MRRILFPLLLLGGLAFGSCGEQESPPVLAKRAAPEAKATVEATSEPASPTTLSEVAAAIDQRLAGLRGEVARRYAQKLLESALPESKNDRVLAVLQALQTGSATVRWVALLAVPSLASLDDALLRAMLRQTEAAEPYLHTATFEALRRVKHIDDSAAEHMWRVQARAPGQLRAALLHGLATARGSDGRQHLLRAAMESPNPTEVRRAATFALMHLIGDEGPTPHPHAELVGPLAERLALDEDSEVRTHAADALARMGAAAAPAARELVGCLRDKSARVRSGAMTALVGIGDPALPFLREALGQRVNDQTEAVVTILRRMGSPAAIAVLRNGLTFDDPSAQGRCAMALTALKVEGVDAMAVFRRLLKSKDADSVLLGLAGLGMLGPSSAPALDAVRPLATHADERVRNAARVWLDFLDRRWAQR